MKIKKEIYVFSGCYVNYSNNLKKKTQYEWTTSTSWSRVSDAKWTICQRYNGVSNIEYKNKKVDILFNAYDVCLK